MNVRLGTRGSKLALWQANRVQSLLEEAGHQVEQIIYKTTGDMNTSQPLHRIGQQGLFTKALDEALLKGEIDIGRCAADIRLGVTVSDSHSETVHSSREDKRIKWDRNKEIFSLFLS